MDIITLVFTSFINIYWQLTVATTTIVSPRQHLILALCTQPIHPVLATTAAAVWTGTVAHTSGRSTVRERHPLVEQSRATSTLYFLLVYAICHDMLFSSLEISIPPSRSVNQPVSACPISFCSFDVSSFLRFLAPCSCSLHIHFHLLSCQCPFATYYVYLTICCVTTAFTFYARHLHILHIFLSLSYFMK